MGQKEALLSGVALLNASHEEASLILAEIVKESTAAVESSDNLPNEKLFKKYRGTIKKMKLQCLQAEIVLAEISGKG